MNKKTAFVPKERHFFLNNMNSWLSNFIIEEFRTDHLPDAKVKNIFMGTTNTSYQPLPRYFHPHETSIQTDYNYSQEVFTNEIFIFNLDDSNLDEVDFVINGLKTLKYDTEKTLVLISNILTWGKTPQKVKTEAEIANLDPNEEEYIEPSAIDDKVNEQNEGEEMEDNGVNEEKEDDDNKDKNEDKDKDKDKRLSLSNHLDNSQITNSKNVSNVVNNANEDSNTNNANTNVHESSHKERIFYYKEHEYTQRVPLKQYFRYKFIETKALAATSQYLRVYIICPGFIYGCGEQFFYDYFKLAWLNKATPISIIGEGKNCIPTIHVLDLMQILRKVIDKKPPTKYIIAVDKTTNTSLKNIITSIVRAMGECKVQTVDDYNIDDIDVPNCLELEVDIKVKTTKYMLDERKPDEDIEDYDKRKFKWHCEYGIPDNMDKIRNEFNVYRGLKSVKMCIVGPPSSGKTKISKQIAEKLQIPYLTVDNVIQWGKELQNEFGDEIRMKEQEIEEAVQKAIEDYDKRKNKKKSDPPLDVHSLRKFPSDFLAKILYHRIQSSDCVGKGYILDNYPKKYQECVDMFIKDEEVLHDILPESVVVISDYTEESLQNNVKSVPSYEDNAAELDARFNRRLNEYKANNEGEGVETVEMFFNKHNIECYHVNQVNSVENYDSEFNGMYAYLERNGPINNYERLCEDDENREIVKHHLSENVMKDNEEIQEEKGESVDDEDDVDEREQQNEDQQVVDTKSNVNKTSNTKKDDDKKDNTNISDNKGDNTQQQQNSNMNNSNQQHNISDVELQNQRKIDELLLRERKLLEKKSEVLRRYLSENVIPLLAKGVLNICQNMPDDPVEALANYLLDNSFNKNDNNIENINHPKDISKDINQSNNNNNTNKNTSQEVQIDQSHTDKDISTGNNKRKISENKQLLDLSKSDQSD